MNAICVPIFAQPGRNARTGTSSRPPTARGTRRRCAWPLGGREARRHRGERAAEDGRSRRPDSSHHRPSPHPMFFGALLAGTILVQYGARITSAFYMSDPQHGPISSRASHQRTRPLYRDRRRPTPPVELEPSTSRESDALLEVCLKRAANGTRSHASWLSSDPTCRFRTPTTAPSMGNPDGRLACRLAFSQPAP
jgi:hypothetical protein